MGIDDGLDVINACGEVCGMFFDGGGLEVSVLEGVEEAESIRVGGVIKEVWICGIPWEGFFGCRVRVGSRIEHDRNGSEEVVFWKIIKGRR